MRFQYILLFILFVYLVFRLKSLVFYCRSRYPYSLKKIFLNESTVDNIETLREEIHWPPIQITPKSNKGNPNVIIVVHSSVGNFERRMILRSDWNQRLKEKYNFQLIFVIGRSLNPIIQRKAEMEAEKFDDILQSKAVDDYRLLPVKAHSWAKYVENRKNLSFILKIDDDVSVNIPGYNEFLLENRQKRRSIFCSTFKHIADRRPNSKWYLPPQEFPFRNLGIFCAGLAYTLTADLIPQINKNIKRRRFVWLDDWYVTHSLLADTDAAIYDISDLYFVSETKREAYRQLRQVLTGQRPTPIFSHLRPRAYFTDSKQKDLWKKSQQCQ